MTTHIAHQQAVDPLRLPQYLGWGLPLGLMAWAWQGARMSPLTKEPLPC